MILNSITNSSSDTTLFQSDGSEWIAFSTLNLYDTHIYELTYGTILQIDFNQKNPKEIWCVYYCGTDASVLVSEFDKEYTCSNTSQTLWIKILSPVYEYGSSSFMSYKSQVQIKTSSRFAGNRDIIVGAYKI